MTLYDVVIAAARYPVDWHLMTGVRVMSILGLLIAAHALLAAHRGRVPAIAHVRGIAYTLLAMCLLGGALLGGQGRLSGQAYQLGVNLGIWLWAMADAYLIGKRRFLNRARRGEPTRQDIAGETP